MYQRKEISWIGFQEAQKSINALKQEVDIAERKLLATKKSFYKRNAGNTSAFKAVPPDPVPNFKHIKLKEKTDVPHCKKDKIPQSVKTTGIKNGEITVPKKLYVANSEEEPNFAPIKIQSSPLDLKQAFAKSQLDNLLFKISSSEDIISTSDARCSSSEGTASLIESTFREIKILKSSETKFPSVPTASHKSGLGISTEEHTALTKIKTVHSSESHALKESANEMEWKIVSQDKPFVKMKHLKPDGIQILRDIIELQKKKQEIYEMELEKKLLTDSESSESVKYVHVKKSPQVVNMENQLESLPVRKLRVVKSLPSYKGFNAPSEKYSHSKRWRTRKLKHSMAKPPPVKDPQVTPRRIQKVVKCESDFVSASYWKKSQKEDKQNNRENDKNKMADDEPLSASSTIKSSKIDSDTKITVNNKELLEKISDIVKEKTISPDNQVEENDSNDSSLKDVNSSLLMSNEVKDSSDSNVHIGGNDDKSGSKENTKPLLLESKTIKRKAKKPPEQQAPSPKIRHYDVDKVRNYIKKKKEERRKRHQEECQKQMHDFKKKKENLEKLYEYHKQSIKPSAKVKPLSPIKLFQKKDILRRKHENEHELEEKLTKSESKDSNFEIKTQENGTSVENTMEIPNEVNKKDLCKKHSPSVTVSNTKRDEIKKKQDDMHIDISLSKFVSAQLVNSSQPFNNSEKLPNSIDISIPVQSLNEKTNFENKPLKKDSLNETFENQDSNNSKLELIEDEDGIHDSFNFKTLSGFENMSCVSTPSEIRIANSEAEEVKKFVKIPRQEAHPNKCDVLRGLVKSINIMTRPFEPLLRTKKWVEDSPPLPQKLLKKNETNTNVKKEREFCTPKRSLDFQYEVANSLNQKDTSFKEQVSAIGDVDELYARILGKSSDLSKGYSNRNSSIHDDNISPVMQQDKTDDALIEGSLLSEDLAAHENEVEFSHHAISSDHSSHFSDLLKPNTVPDPFNLVNTWKRKPLSLPVYGKHEINDASISIPFRSPAEGDGPCDENYKSDFTSSYVSSFNTEMMENGSGDHASDYSLQQNAKSSCSKLPENFEVDNKLNQNMGDISYKPDLSTSNHVLSHIYENQPKAKDSEILNVKSITLCEDQLNGTSSVKISDELTHKSHETTLGHSVDLSVSEVNISENFNETAVDLHKSGLSEMLISGTINSEYSLDGDLEESSKETGQGRASASGSSISEVISVVENSKGLRSSAEDVLSDKIVASEYPSAISSSSSTSKGYVKSDINENGVKSSIQLEIDNLKSTSVSSNSTDKNAVVLPKNSLSPTTEKNSEHSAILPKNDHLQSIASGSQNSVTIDFRHPLRFTLSNTLDESGQPPHRGMDLHEEQYLHTQVVTRVASEAAAAAATSAVIAVFETQKALLAENGYLDVLTSFAKPSSTKKTPYSSDFESSPATKTSSHSSHSSTSESKQTKPVSESISGEVNTDVSIKSESPKSKSSKSNLAKSKSPKTDSVDENILLSQLEINSMLPSKTPSVASVKTDENIASVYSQESMNQGLIRSQRSKRKISGNFSSPSPASLSDNESLSSETIMSSHSNISQPSESVLSDGSFAQLTLDVVRRMTHEEELRARHQLSLLQLQERTLVEKARAEMMWLELSKKKLKKRGAENEISSIKKRKKELILWLRQERAQLRCMQEAYRSICEKHRSLLEDKKKLLSEPHPLALQLFNKDEKSMSSRHSDRKELSKSKSTSSTPTGISDSDHKMVIDEDSISEVPEVLKGLASNSSQESVIDTNPSEVAKTSNSSQSKSQRSSPNSFSPVVAAQSNSNPSLHSNNSSESTLQGLKKLEASKRHLTKREQRLLYRRKLAETVLQWNMSLDSDEIEVKQLEEKALELVKQSKKKTKHYISSPGSIPLDDDMKTMSEHESEPAPTKIMKQTSLNSDKSSAQTANENKDHTSEVTSDENIVTNVSESEVLEVIETEKEGSQVSIAEQSGSVSEAKTEISIQTLEASGSSSHIDEVISEEVSFQVSPSVKDKSSSSDIYSESFESSVSKKTSSVPSSSSPFKNSSPSRSVKKDKEFKIRLPLVPRNVRRHDSSGSDDSYTISHSETASDQSDIEVRIHALAEELRRRKVEAEKLKKEHKKKYREQLKEKELSLQKQLEAYNQYIHKAKLELEHQIESAISPPQVTDTVVKPRIKWPRPEQVIDSRRVRKQASLSETFPLEKKAVEVSHPVSLEVSETSPTPISKDAGKQIMKTLPDAKPKSDSDVVIKEILENRTSDSKEIPGVNDESLEISDLSESNKPISSEISSDIKEVSEINENSSDLSIQVKNLNESNPAEQNYNQSATASVISSVEESKSSCSIADSKSQSDTFLSETASQSSDLSSSKQSDNSSPSKTSDDEQNTKISKELYENSRESENETKFYSHEATSEESVSEVISASVDEELESEISSQKSSKCSGSGGCESPIKTKVHKNSAVLSKNNSKEADAVVKSKEIEMDIHDNTPASNIVNIESAKKSIATESQVVNIVNYLSSSLIDDTLTLFFDLSNQKTNQNNLLNMKLQKNKNIIENLSLSLFDKFLKDTLYSFFKILKGYSKTSLMSTNINSNLLSQSIAPVKSNQKSELQNESIIIQDINDNKILAKQTKWNEDTFVSSQKDVSQLEQQLALQQYSYFYRKIPNKPPPPYTPPSSTPVFEFPFLKAKAVEKVPTVKDVAKNADEVLDHMIEVILDEKRKGLDLSDISFLSEESLAEKLDLNTPHQLIFMDLMFDLTKELAKEKFDEVKVKQQSWLRPRKLTQKSLFPKTKEELLLVLKKELERTLKIDEDSSIRKKQTLWSSMKLGRKKRDFVDTILISELKEEEPDWVNYDQDEITVKFQIADSIFSVLIDDTIKIINDLQDKISS